jgi:tRNA-intron endonuclease
MIRGVLADNKVIAEGEEALEFFEKGWYGEKKDNRVEFHLIEAALLAERGRLEIIANGKVLTLKEFFDIACSLDEDFMVKYLVYKDLRTRGLPVRIGAKGVDFFVYERGAKPHKHSGIKWITFAYSENRACSLDELERTARLGKNVRAKVVWAIVDGDHDVTYYIVERKTEL